MESHLLLTKKQW